MTNDYPTLFAACFAYLCALPKRRTMPKRGSSITLHKQRLERLMEHIGYPMSIPTNVLIAVADMLDIRHDGTTLALGRDGAFDAAKLAAINPQGAHEAFARFVSMSRADTIRAIYGR